jgi:tetratricopeptide (TPR) repeat protein
VAGVMNRLKRSASGVVEGHGGMVNQFVGDEVLALFGVPRAHDDDPIRALRAAFELHAAVRALGDELAPRLGRALRLHTAIETGLMVTQLRDPLDGVYGVTGNAINTAARLVKQAAGDEILVGPEAWRATRDEFESECVGPLRLRGKAEPIVVYRVLRPAARKRSVAGSDWDALCGRRAELETLRRAFEQTCEGGARLLGVSGEPGVGKTRLFREFGWRSEPHALVLRGQCLSLGTVAPWQPFRDVVRAALLSEDDGRSELERAAERIRSLEPSCERHFPALLALLSIQMDAHPMPGEALSDRVQESYLAALEALLRGLARERPLVLLLEDWHWADPASELALEHLAQTLARERLLLLVNFRSHHEPSWVASAQRLELAPLGVEDTRAIVRRLLGEVPEALLRRIQERTGGNPLFIEELCQTVRELGAERGLAPQRVIGDVVPDTVAAVVRARIDRLAPAQVELLKLASVLGEEFPRALLEQLAGSAARVETSLERLVRAELLQEQPDGRCRFKHAIVQDVAYAMLLHRRRRALHGAVGACIEAEVGPRIDEQVERLAHHFARSDEREKAVFYLECSGDKAAASGAMLQALGHYREAVSILDELTPDAERMRRRIELTQKLASVAIYRPWRSMRDVLALSYDFARRLGDARSERRSLYWMGWLDASLGCWPEALLHFERCIPLAQASGDRKLQAQLDSNVGQVLFHTGDFSRAVEHLERSIELRRSLGNDLAAASVVAYSQGYLALIDCESGRFDRADERLEEAFKLAEASRQLQLEGALRCMRLTVDAFRGSWDACAAGAAELATRAQRIGSTYMLAMSRTLGGYARYAQGEHTEGVAEMRSGIELLERADNGMNLSLLYGCLAGALSVVGSLDEAESLALRALERAALQDRMGEPTARRVLFAVAARRAPRGGPEVEAALESALEAARRRGSAREEAVTWLRAAEVLGQARDAGWRRALLDDLVERFEALQLPWHRARAEALLAELQ